MGNVVPIIFLENHMKLITTGDVLRKQTIRGHG